MKRKIGKATLMITLLLICVLMSAVNIQPAKSSGLTEAYYPSEFSLYYGTQYVGGSLINLQSDDGVSMQFRSAPTGPTVRPLYAHQEWISIAGVNYLLLKLGSSDAAGTILSAPTSAPTRIPLGRFVYSLTGISSIMASYWFFVYYARADAGVGAYINVDIKILTSGGGIRQVITMYAANSPSLPTSWTALSGGFSFPGYGVVDQTDYLLVEYYANIVTPYSGGVYLLIDNSSLPTNYQTSVNNVALPQDQTMAVEFRGLSDTCLWSKLTWIIDSAWSVAGVQVTFQLFNFSAGAYPSSGDGYIEYTSSGTPLTYETKSQEITTNSTDFRSTSGLWRVMVKGVKYAISFPFIWYADFMQYQVRYLSFVVPDDFPTIQQAINAASPGYLIYVRSGVYYENLLVNKTIRLEGENPATTVIDSNEAGYAIKVVSNNVVISNFTIRNRGILLYRVNSCKVIGNNITNGGVLLDHVNSCEIIGNNITNNRGGGIYLEYSSDNNISANNITNNKSYGIVFADLSNNNNNTISGNTVTNTQEICGIRICGDNNVITGNIVSNNTSPSVVGILIGGPASTPINNNTVANNTVTNNYIGIRMHHWYGDGTGNMLYNNTVSNNVVGFDATIETLARTTGTYERNALFYNVIANNDIGIQMSGLNINVSSNTIINNDYGIKLEGAFDNSIYSNTITGNNESIYLKSSPNNIVVSNDIKDNTLGIHLSDSFDNSFFSNNFTNNINQVYIETDNNNSWDNCYPWGGNYWSDYVGVDQHSGPYQNETGSDGIGDTPYNININNRDRYPLMNPYVGSLPPTYTLTIALQGQCGATTPKSGTYTYFYGHKVGVTATTCNGWYLDHWELDSINVGSANPISVTMDSNHTLLAVLKYDVTVKAFDVTEGLDVNVDIWMDGSPTGYKTPHTFTGLTETHAFSVPEIDPYNHPTKRGNSSTVTSGTTVIFYYGEETVIRFVPLETSVWMNQTFTIKVVIENVVELYGFDIKIRWNTTYLQYVSHTATVPVENYPGGTLHSPVFWAKNEVDATAGTYWLVVANMEGASPFNGNGTAFSMTFKSLNQSGVTTLDFISIDLIDNFLHHIPHTSIPGVVEILPGYVPYDIAVTNITNSKTVVGQGYSTNIDVTVANQGNFTETFNVTVYAQPQGLIGYWNFDEGTGPIAHDSSGNNNDGTIYGATWTSGKYGQSLSFDGVDDYVEIAENTDLDPHTSNWTISAWVNIARLTGPYVFGNDWEYGFVIVGKRQTEFGDYSLTLLAHGGTSETSPAKFAFVLDGPSQAAGAESDLINVFGWHHVVGVRRSGELYVYVDGVEYGPNNFFQDGSHITPTTDVNSNTPIHLGHHGAWNQYYNGIIDEVKIYNRALSAEEIWAEYTGQTGFVIGTQTVTLESGASTTLTFTWNTSGFAKGNYTIWAYAWPVQGETDTADNTCTNGVVTVTISGDLDGDFAVGLVDLVILARHYDHSPPDGHLPNTPVYTECFNADIDGNGIVGLSDLVIMARYYGKTDP